MDLYEKHAKGSQIASQKGVLHPLLRVMEVAA
jgi:hypothetical protein